MVKQEVTVGNFLNSYENPFAELVQLACKFDSIIHLEYGTKRINAKSIMGIMSFQVDADSKVSIDAEGKDETEAVNAIEQYLTCS